MKSLILNIIVSFISSVVFSVLSQEMPLLSPGYTNSFLYNPSLAGGTFKSTGSVFIAKKSSFSEVPGHPVSTILSANMPVKNYKMGIGFNLFNDKVNVFQTTYTSLAYAYNVYLARYKCLSFGLSADMYYTGLDYKKVNIDYQQQTDQQLIEYTNGKYRFDFSTGVNYHTVNLSAGLTVNRITGLFSDKNKHTAYYSGYLKYAVPLYFERDLLEPMVTYRQLPYALPMGNAGIIYSYKHKNTLGRTNDGILMAGVFISTKLQIGFLGGVKILKRVQLTYNFESSGKYEQYVGPSHEFSLVTNIIDLNMMEWYNEYLNWDNKKLKLKRSLKRNDK